MTKLYTTAHHLLAFSAIYWQIQIGENPRVGGSIPPLATIFITTLRSHNPR